MAENLKKLYNTLLLIETKGESTKIMAECLTFTMGMIKEAEREKKVSVKDKLIEKKSKIVKSNNIKKSKETTR